jgi:translation initiation factor 4E
VREAFAGCGPGDVEGGCARQSWEDALEGKNGTSGEDAGDTDAPEIWECTISVRQSENIISLWNRVDGARVRERIRCVGSLLFFLVSLLAS